MPQPNPLGAQSDAAPPPREPVRTFTAEKVRSVRSDPQWGHGASASLEYAEMDMRRSNARSQSRQW